MTTNLLLTDWFKVNYNVIDWSTAPAVKVKLYSRSPYFDRYVDTFKSLSSIADLDAKFEWVGITTMLTSKVAGIAAPISLRKYTVGTNDVLRLVTAASLAVKVEGSSYSGWHFGTGQDVVSAAVYYLDGTSGSVVNPILFATTQGIGENVVAQEGSIFGQSSPGSSIIADGTQYVLGLNPIAPAATTVTNRAKGSTGVATLTTSTPHSLTSGDVATITGVSSAYNITAMVMSVPTSTTFTYQASGTTEASTSSSGTVTPKSTKFAAGYNLLNLAFPKWESSSEQHLWIQPQRINFIANPSFERSSAPVPYWRVGKTLSGSAAIARSTGGVGGTARPHCGNVTTVSGGTGNTVIESNMFPVVGNWYSISFYLSSGSATTIKYGLVGYDSSYSSPLYVRSKSVSVSAGTAASGYQYFTGLVQIPPNIEGLSFRVESSGSSFYIDNVLVDPHESQYEYFDGNSTDGLPGDFRWMGGPTSYSNRHFSLWYNNYISTRGRLVGDFDTAEGVYKTGLVEEWSPTGSSITPHWDAVTNLTPLNWSGDSFYPIVNNNGSPISVIGSDNHYDLALNKIAESD